MTLGEFASLIFRAKVIYSQPANAMSVFISYIDSAQIIYDKPHKVTRLKYPHLCVYPLTLSCQRHSKDGSGEALGRMKYFNRKPDEKLIFVSRLIKIYLKFSMYRAIDFAWHNSPAKQKNTPSQ